MMRTVVALVEARPETIQQDYQRVLTLAKFPCLLSRPTAQDPLSIWVDHPSHSFRPGYGATPWQLAGVLSHLADSLEDTCLVAVSGHGAVSFEKSFMNPWLASQGDIPLAKAEFLRLHRHLSSQLHPGLDEALSRGVQLPVGMAQSNGLLLSAPSLTAWWGISGAVAMLYKIVMAGVKAPRRASVSELVAEALAVALEVMPQVGAVLDGTLFGVARRGSNGGQSGGSSNGLCVARNVLLAGNDPLAVDVVAMRLAGLDPGQVPWVRLCHQRGMGCGRLEEIRIVGRTDLLDLDFELGDGTVGAMTVAAWASPLRTAWDRLANRTKAGGREGRFEDSVWEKLSAEYLHGNVEQVSPKRSVDRSLTA